jgi:hypothetical protein
MLIFLRWSQFAVKDYSIKEYASSTYVRNYSRGLLLSISANFPLMVVDASWVYLKKVSKHQLKQASNAVENPSVRNAYDGFFRISIPDVAV